MNGKQKERLMRLLEKLSYRMYRAAHNDHRLYMNLYETALNLKRYIRDHTSAPARYNADTIYFLFMTVVQWFDYNIEYIKTFS